VSIGLSISGDDDDWQVFGKRAAGHDLLFKTCDGRCNRDLFFARGDLDDLRAEIKSSTSAETISLEFSIVSGKQAFLKGLCLSPWQKRAARARQQPGSGNLLGKLLGH
jgi:hypothetical protein